MEIDCFSECWKHVRVKFWTFCSIGMHTACINNYYDMRSNWNLLTIQSARILLVTNESRSHICWCHKNSEHMRLIIFIDDLLLEMSHFAIKLTQTFHVDIKRYLILCAHPLCVYSRSLIFESNLSNTIPWSI